MTNAQRPTADFGPFAYESGDSVGLCLDIDGTVYRSGSVFIETLAFLPYADGITLTPAERRYRRTALTAVAEYHGGFVGKTKWRGVLTGLDTLRAVGCPNLSETLLTTLARRRSDGQPRRDGPPPTRRTGTSAIDRYRKMREAILESYGSLLQGRRRSDVMSAVANVVDRRCSMDARLRATLDRVADCADTDLYLVTDMPDHIATAYARKLRGVSQVVGVTYHTDDADRYTGEFDRVDKGTTVSRLRAERGWEYVLAAGDSPGDLPMASEADCFLAVAGQSHLADHMSPSDTVSPCDSAATLHERLAPDRKFVRVPTEAEFGSVLETTLRAVGIYGESRRPSGRGECQAGKRSESDSD